jgi:hypothetical protein
LRDGTRGGGTSAVGTRRGTVSARANLVIQTQCQRDAFARQVDLQDLDADRRAIVEHGRSFDLFLADGKLLAILRSMEVVTSTYWGSGLTGRRIDSTSPVGGDGRALTVMRNSVLDDD